MDLAKEIMSSMERLRGSGAAIEAAQVKRWMSSSDIDVLGAAYNFVMDDRYYKKIRPALTIQDYKSFLFLYYERCLRENPQSSWADSRYSAGWDLANWLNSLWKDGYKEVLGEARDWLAALYKSADPEIRICIVNATLEHVLDNRAIARVFKGWEDDPVLRTAYCDALDWSSPRGRPS
jgi:hypothetical protein